MLSHASRHLLAMLSASAVSYTTTFSLIFLRSSGDQQLLAIFQPLLLCLGGQRVKWCNSLLQAAEPKDSSVCYTPDSCIRYLFCSVWDSQASRW